MQASRREKERQIREAEIVAAAQQIFVQRGFDKASMDDIAREAQFTKRTLYQYFPSKEELYLAVKVKCFSRLLGHFRAAAQQGKCGYEKVTLLGQAYHQFFLESPEALGLLFGGVESSEETPNLQKLNALKGSAMQELIQTIAEGQKDGSIRPDLDPRLGAYGAIYMLSGFFYMLSIAGRSFEEDYMLSREDFIHSSLGLWSDSFRAAPTGM